MKWSITPYSWITGNAMVVKPLNDNLNVDFIYNALLRSKMAAAITGSAQPQITRTNLAPLGLDEPTIVEEAKYSLLKSMGVKVQLIQEKTYQDAYHKCIKNLERV